MRYTDLQPGWLERISPAERRVIEALIETGSVKEAADLIGIKRPTAEVHFSRIRAKTNIPTKMHIALAYLKETGRLL